MGRVEERGDGVGCAEERGWVGDAKWVKGLKVVGSREGDIGVGLFGAPGLDVESEGATFFGFRYDADFACLTLGEALRKKKAESLDEKN